MTTSLTTLTTIVMLTAVLDLIWVFGSGIYNKYIAGSLNAWTIAGLWAVVIISQSLLLYFLTKGTRDWISRAMLGALQGFTVYSVFNITSKVVFPSSMWPTQIALIDTLWGTILFALVAAVTGSDGLDFDTSILHPASIMN